MTQRDFYFPNNITDLLDRLNTPVDGVEGIRIQGEFNLLSLEEKGMICGYKGDLVITRNEKNPNWYSVENFTEDRDSNSSDFTSQFYMARRWVHVPHDITGAKKDYARATVHPGSLKVPPIAQARFYVNEQQDL